MKTRRKWMAVAAAIAVTAAIGGCQAGGKQAETAAAAAETTTAAGTESTAPQATEPETTTAAETKSTEPVPTRTFVDSAGREVEIPVTVTKVAPSGSLAQLVLYTVCPDKLGGLAAEFTDEAKEYVDEKYWGLPVFGKFYGKNANLNMEALIAAAPDVIIDVGEAKKTVKEDMDALQKQLGIPVVFVEGTLPTMESAYAMLGDVTGEREQAEKLSAYCKGILARAEKNMSSIPDEKRKSVYFAMGDDGLHTNAHGAIHSDVIDTVGAINAADIKADSKGGESEVSFEQLLLWQPDIVIADSQALYDKIVGDKVWKELSAVSGGRVYKIPTAPYSFMSNPPSVNRLIGIQWLGGLAYPDTYQVDIKEEVKEFYRLFYHIEVTEEQLGEILKSAM